MVRKQMQVYNGVKTVIQDLKKELDFKNESEVLAYLYAVRDIYKDKITFTQHKEALAKADEIIYQQTI